jgi:hypothetical protein
MKASVQTHKSDVHAETYIISFTVQKQSILNDILCTLAIFNAYCSISSSSKQASNAGQQITHNHSNSEHTSK